MTLYAALSTRSIFHEGDERSRISPGHGYPAYTETVDTIKLFKDEAEMLIWVKGQSRNAERPFQIIRYENVEIKQTFTVEVI